MRKVFVSLDSVQAWPPSSRMHQRLPHTFLSTKLRHHNAMMKPLPLALTVSSLLGVLTLFAAETDTGLPVLGEATRIKSNQSGHRERGFGDIAYHFIVGDSGQIYEGRRTTLAPASNTYYLSPEELKTQVASIHEGKIQVASAFRAKARERIPGHTKGHLTVSFLCGGRVRNGELVDHPELLEPAAMQRAAVLVAELLVKHGLQPKDIRAHRELAETNCPNDAIYRWLRGKTMSQDGRGEGMKLIEAEFERLKNATR
jgi:hypothetical protein